MQCDIGLVGLAVMGEKPRPQHGKQGFLGGGIQPHGGSDRKVRLVIVPGQEHRAQLYPGRFRRFAGDAAQNHDHGESWRTLWMRLSRNCCRCSPKATSLLMVAIRFTPIPSSRERTGPDKAFTSWAPCLGGVT
jgi:hypothetical protein